MNSDSNNSNNKKKSMFPSPSSLLNKNLLKDFFDKNPLQHLINLIKLKIAIILSGCLLVIVIFGVIVSLLIAPIDAVLNFVDDVSNFFDKAGTWLATGHFVERDNAWYAEVNEQYEKYKEDDIYIDRAIIASAIFYDQFLIEEDSDNGDTDKFDDIEDTEDLDELIEENGEGRSNATNDLLVFEARILSEAFGEQGHTLTEEEVKEVLKKSFAEYKLTMSGVKIPKNEAGKEKTINEFVEFVFLKKEVYDSLFSDKDAFSVCGGEDIPVDEFKSMTTSEYISRMAPLAQADYMTSNILPSVTLAQSILESGWGKSGLAQKGKNFFGMKAGTKFENGGWDGVSTIDMLTEEHGSDGYYTVTARWRKYETVSASIKDHGALLNSSRYKKKGVPDKTDARSQITAIKAAGYATSPNYVSSVMNIINHYDLEKYDTKNNSSSNSDLCVVNGDYAEWKQTSKVGYAPWENTPLGNSDATIRSAGCLMTSIAIQIARSGTAVTISDFNPGTFVEWQNEHNGFTSDGNFKWNLSGVAPNFKKVVDHRHLSSTGPNSSRVVGEVSDLINKGYYVVIHVSGASTSNHWVAVDKVQDNKIYIYDPAGPNGLVTQKYTAIDSIVAFSAS